MSIVNERIVLVVALAALIVPLTVMAAEKAA
jgi:hypothetical protein